MPSTPREKRRQMTYEDLVDRLYYDEAVGRFRFARNMPPKGKQGDLAGAWNPEKKTWQISWQGAPSPWPSLYGSGTTASGRIVS